MMLISVVLGIILLILLLVMGWYVMTLNGMIAKRNRLLQCESGISVILKQRNDLIPNLISSVQVYMQHEKELLTRITELRSKSAASDDVKHQVSYGTEMSKLLRQLQVSVEAYPELKSNEQFHTLQASLWEMEDQLQAIRRTYNAAATQMNNAVEMFPSSIVANSRGFDLVKLIEIPEAEKANVNVKDLFKQ